MSLFLLLTAIRDEALCYCLHNCLLR